MSLLETIVHSLSTSVLANPLYFFIIAVIATMLWGDASMVLFSIISTTLGLPFILVLIAGYIGATIGDTIWFLAGYKILPFFIDHHLFSKGYKKIVNVIEAVAHKNITVTLTIVKPLYGTRIITILYLANKKIGVWRFMRCNALALMFWALYMGGLGYLVAKGFRFIFNTFKSIQLALSLLVLFFILFNIIQKQLNKKIEHLKKKRKK